MVPLTTSLHRQGYLVWNQALTHLIKDEITLPQLIIKGSLRHHSGWGTDK